MDKTQLIESIAIRSGLTKKDAAAALTATVDTVTAALAAGEEVRLIGFGTFTLRHRPAREGRNPKTEEKMIFPETVLPVFKAGAKLKAAVAPKT